MSTMLVNAGCALQIRAFFGDDRPFYRTDLHTDPAVNAGRKINPIPIGSFKIFTGSLVYTGNGTSRYTICDAFADICDNGMRHRVYRELERFEIHFTR
jgi:hypothetical protein